MGKGILIKLYFSPKTPSFRSGIQGRFSTVFQGFSLDSNGEIWYNSFVYGTGNYNFGTLAVVSVHPL